MGDRNSSRLTDEEVAPFVGTPDDDEGGTAGHGAGGKEAEPGGPSCFARASYDPRSGRTRHFVKFALEGPSAGRMADPSLADDVGKGADWSARGRYAFRAVTPAAYAFYMQFLKTGNPAYLRQAEREVDL